MISTFLLALLSGGAIVFLPLGGAPRRGLPVSGARGAIFGGIAEMLMNHVITLSAVSWIDVPASLLTENKPKEELNTASIQH